MRVPFMYYMSSLRSTDASHKNEIFTDRCIFRIRGYKLISEFVNSNEAATYGQI